MFMDKDLSKSLNIFQTLEDNEREDNPNNCHDKAEQNQQNREVHLSLQVKVVSETLHNGMPRFVVTANAKEIIGYDLAGQTLFKHPPYFQLVFCIAPEDAYIELNPGIPISNPQTPNLFLWPTVREMARSRGVA